MRQMTTADWTEPDVFVNEIQPERVIRVRENLCRRHTEYDCHVELLYRKIRGLKDLQFQRHVTVEF